MSLQSEMRRIRARTESQKRRRKDRVADGVPCAHGAPHRRPCRFSARGRFARHGDAWPRDDGAGAARPHDHARRGGGARVEARARGCRYALRLLRGSPPVAFRNAARIMKETGCGAVKLEGGRRMAETITYLVERGIPVMAHIGLTPQSVNVMGGFKTQGRRQEEWAAIEADASAVAEAGAFAVVLEGMAELSRRRSRAHPDSHHRHRRLGRMRRSNPRARRHAWPFAVSSKFEDVRGTWRAPSRRRDYAAEVRARQFPAKEHVYAMANRRPTRRESRRCPKRSQGEQGVI